jgi:UDP-N-acetylglucosamine 3-dehydrogenase
MRIGLIGLGMMGRNHARVLSSMDGVEFVGVADPAGDLLRVAGTAPVVTRFEDLLDLGLDACVLATPTATHTTLGLRLAEANIHTLIEKPLAATTHDATNLAEAFGRRGLIGCVGHIERYNPALRALRERLDDDTLGGIHQVATRRQGPFPDRVSDVGVVKDLATHDIDLTAWVTRSRFRSVTAHTANKSGREHEDLVAVVGRLHDGTITNHLVNWLSPMKERITVVTGERGCYVADTLAADLTFFENGVVRTEWEAIARFRGVSEGNMIRYAIPKPEPLRIELEAFRDAVAGANSDIVSMVDGLRTVVVAEACLKSSRTGATVDLDTTQRP